MRWHGRALVRFHLVLKKDGVDFLVHLVICFYMSKMDLKIVWGIKDGMFSPSLLVFKG